MPTRCQPDANHVLFYKKHSVCAKNDIIYSLTISIITAYKAYKAYKAFSTTSKHEMANLPEVTIEMSIPNDRHFFDAIRRAVADTESKFPEMWFKPNIIIKRDCRFEQSIGVENYNIALQLVEFMREMVKFLNDHVLFRSVDLPYYKIYCEGDFVDGA